MPAQNPFFLRLVPYCKIPRRGNIQLHKFLRCNEKESNLWPMLKIGNKFTIRTIERLPNLDFRGLVRRQLVLQGVPSPTKQLPVQSVAGRRVADLF
jgi:hypothetical protein